MTLDLAQFHVTFFDESFEALGSMEAALLKLSAGDADGELINTIFRVAHSIKGGSATFGFVDVAAFTHTLETLLDQLRSGQRPVHSGLVDVLLRSVDVLREMLSATQRKQPADPALTAGLHAELQAIVSSPGLATPWAATAVPVTLPVSSGKAPPAAEAQAVLGWRIRLEPGALMMEHGNDPLRMLRELATLGTLVTRVDAGKLPTLAEVNPEVCLLCWQMELRTGASRSAVEQIFEWAEGECTLTIEPLSPAAATQ
jgi:two-component system chemotaxis sensor kinase CheA